MATLTPAAQEIFGGTYDEPDHLWLHAVRESPGCRPRVPEAQASSSGGSRSRGNEKVGERQIEAIVKWGVQREGSYDYLKTIKQPTLVVNGNKDLIIYTVNSFILQQNIPNAQLILYPDSNHGSPYQS
jgi:pimeloyl-ACP methyl ester carboxylesterase